MKYSLFCMSVLSALAVCADVSVKRVFRSPRNSRGNTNSLIMSPIDEAAWIKHPEQGTTPSFWRFAKEFISDGSKLTFDVSADERFILFMDGKLVARGPNRGTVENWMFNTYEVTLEAGRHLAEAVVWQAGRFAPLAQHSYKGGFIFKASGSYDNQLTTGKAKWKVGRIENIKSLGKDRFGWGCGGTWESFGTGFHVAKPRKYVNAVVERAALKSTMRNGVRKSGWMLFPSGIPDQTEIAVAVDKNPITIPANAKKTFYRDLGNYYCAYPVLKTSGGKDATITWGWAESLYETNKTGSASKIKGDRNKCEGKCFMGTTDVFRPDGRANAEFTLPWWRAGRWCRFTVETKGQPLTIDGISIIESRYPLEDEGSFVSDDSTIPDVEKICVRGMQMCDHEMLFDCPYYEQQMYPGDTRVQLLVLNALSSDDRMIRRVLDIYDLGKRDNGMIPMNWPTSVLQESATYTMCYILMYGDYINWHKVDMDWMKARYVGFNATMRGLQFYENADGLLVDIPGWTFIDWVPAWSRGVAPDCGSRNRPAAINNLFWVLSQQTAAQMARFMKEAPIAEYWEDRARRTFDAVMKLYWNENRGMIADSLDHNSWSEHAQALAILTGLLPSGKEARVFDSLVTEKDLHRCTVYFSYYLFEALFKHARGDIFNRKLDLWRQYVRSGLKTPLESPDLPGRSARSDCHAWGSHPIYFMRTGLAGIKPDAPNFSKVKIAPSPGKLKKIKSALPHPDGIIEVDFSFDGDRVTGTIKSPVPGRFVWKGKETPISCGATRIDRR